MTKYFVQIDDVVREATPEEAARIEQLQKESSINKDDLES